MWEYKNLHWLEEGKKHHREGTSELAGAWSWTVLNDYPKAFTSLDQFASVANALPTSVTSANIVSTSSGVSCASSQLGMTCTCI